MSLMSLMTALMDPGLQFCSRTFNYRVLMTLWVLMVYQFAQFQVPYLNGTLYRYGIIIICSKDFLSFTEKPQKTVIYMILFVSIHYCTCVYLHVVCIPVSNQITVHALH